MSTRAENSEWRQAPPEVVSRISQALERFTGETGVPAKRLAQVLGRSACDLSPSHLRQRALLLYWSLRREELPEIALALGLHLAGFRALQRLSATLGEALGGYAIPEESWRGSRQEAVAAGSVGVALFDRHEWDAAISHLAPAWSVLTSPPPRPGDPEFATVVRTGTQLLHYLCYGGETHSAVAVGRTLLKLGADSQGADRTGRHALALSYRSVAVAAHHQGLNPPEGTLRWARRAAEMLREAGVDPLGQAGALRDQAKPRLMVDAGAELERISPDSADAALALLDQAEQLAGGSAPEEPDREEWLLTRLTRIHCLGVLGAADAARRAWEELEERPFAARIIQDPAHPSAGKVMLAQVALSLARGDLDAVAAAAGAFQANPANARYGDRLRRAWMMETAALSGDRTAIRGAILR